MRAYVMINTSPGKVESVAKELRSRPFDDAQLQIVDTVTGRFDIIAILLGRDLDSVAQAVSGSIQAIEGVKRTMICLVIGSPNGARTT